MAKLKHYKSGYRPPTLAFQRAADDPFFTKQAEAYLEWLCVQRDWRTAEKPCISCHGMGSKLPETKDMMPSRLRSWKKKRVKEGLKPYYTEEDRQTCAECDGAGKLPVTMRCKHCDGFGDIYKGSHATGKCPDCGGKGRIPTTMLDLDRARNYIQAQQDRLEQLAHSACEEIEKLLRQQGLRPVVTRSTIKVSTLAEYDAWEEEKARLAAECDKAHEAGWQAKAAFETEFATWPGERQCEYFNGSEKPPYVALEQHANQLSRDLRQYGDQLHGLWSFPGCKETLYVGTRATPRYYDYPTPFHVIRIKPGRAPSKPELAELVEEAIYVLKGLTETEIYAARNLRIDLDKLTPKPKVQRRRLPDFFEFSSLRNIGISGGTL